MGTIRDNTGEGGAYIACTTGDHEVLLMRPRISRAM